MFVACLVLDMLLHANREKGEFIIIKLTRLEYNENNNNNNNKKNICIKHAGCVLHILYFCCCFSSVFEDSCNFNGSIKSSAILSMKHRDSLLYGP